MNIQLSLSWGTLRFTAASVRGRAPKARDMRTVSWKRSCCIAQCTLSKANKPKGPNTMHEVDHGYMCETLVYRGSGVRLVVYTEAMEVWWWMDRVVGPKKQDTGRGAIGITARRQERRDVDIAGERMYNKQARYRLMPIDRQDPAICWVYAAVITIRDDRRWTGPRRQLESHEYPRSLWKLRPFQCPWVG